MNVNTISMKPMEAKAAYEQYRNAVKLRHNEEDAAIAAGYRVLAQGKSVINVREAISQAGVDEQHHPKLAIARADAKHVFYRGYNSGSCRFVTNDWARTIRGGFIEYPDGTLPVRTDGGWSIDLKAIVPNVPPGLRPAGALRRYFILWEADWKRVPHDPMLLRHLGGELFAVLAVWDLTEIERAVLSGTRR